MADSVSDMTADNLSIVTRRERATVSFGQTQPGDIRAVVKPGQKVWITDVHGRQFKGRIVDMRGDALTIAARR